MLVRFGLFRFTTNIGGIGGGGASHNITASSSWETIGLAGSAGLASSSLTPQPSNTWPRHTTTFGIGYTLCYFFPQVQYQYQLLIV
jgi:hypothetical protein